MPLVCLSQPSLGCVDQVLVSLWNLNENIAEHEMKHVKGTLCGLSKLNV